MAITDTQLERYARHIVMEEVGEEGQEKLLKSRVLVIGAGGLGSPVLMYLAAVGVVDHDVVDTSNLQRQIVHSTENVGDPKVASASERLYDINPEVKVEAHRARFTPENAMDLVSKYDLVVDGSDNFTTRYLANDACFFAKKPLVSGALLRFEGQLATFRPFEEGENRPCYRCLFPSPPKPNMVPRCETAGIFGAVAGVIGTLQATEVLKELLQLGDGLSGRLLLYEGLSGNFRTLKVKRDPGCALCGDQPSIKGLEAAKPAAE
jgi:molybdopterin/thiamine biosynthesis adenylyltransferase